MYNSIIKYFFFIAAITVASLGCKKKETPHNSTVFYTHNNHLIKKKFDSLGKLLSVQSLTFDSLLDGPQIFYYNNGQIKKWIWRQKEDSISRCGAYYNLDGKFDTLRGNPFLDSRKNYPRGKSVTILNPPGIKYVLFRQEYYKGKFVQALFYDPELTDSTSHIVMERHNDKLIKGHEYILNFFIIDSSYKILSHAEIAMKIDFEKYSFIRSPKVARQQLIEE